VRGAIINRILLRWLWLVLIAAVELTWLALRIQAPPTGLLSYTRGLPAIFITSLVTLSVLGWVFSYGRLREFPIFDDFSPTSWRWLLCHLGAFAVFSYLTISVFENDVTSSAFAALWILAWAATGFVTGVFWMLALLPARAWLRLALNNLSVILAALIIGAAAWALGCLASMTWETLRGPTFLIVRWLLQACGQDVVSQPADFVLGTKQFSVAIAAVCSGYQGMGLITAFVGGYLWLFRRSLRFPQAYLLLPCAILAMWLVNAGRIASLVLIGTYVSPEIAVGGFHSQVGWLCFIGVALGMVAVAQRMPFFDATETKPADRAGEISPTTAYLAPLVALLGFTMITGALSSGFDWLYPARVLGTGVAIWLFWRRSMARRTLAQSWSWTAVGIGVAVFVIWVGLERVTGRPDSGSSIAKALGEMPAGPAAAWLCFRVVGAVVTVPLSEELAFRGYLLRRLISADFDRLTLVRFTWLSFLLSSVLFGALHGRWLAGTVAGMCYGFAMYRRGKVADAVIAHATTNALIAADVLILGNWGLW
jgi:exosortase E/protease (VPEID-CTERM system)